MGESSISLVGMANISEAAFNSIFHGHSSSSNLRFILHDKLCCNFSRVEAHNIDFVTHLKSHSLSNVRGKDLLSRVSYGHNNWSVSC